jgi:hypothetical protein
VNLEALALRRAEEQMDSGSWRVEDPKPPKRPGAMLCRRRCLRCRLAKVTPRNKSNLCRDCYRRSTPRQRESYREGVVPPMRMPVRHSRAYVERLRERLAAKGIIVSTPTIVKHQCCLCPKKSATYEGSIPRRWVQAGRFLVCDRCAKKRAKVAA